VLLPGNPLSREVCGVADADKPNILVIWGDDIGITNLSCYSDGLMGYRTPNIDRIAAGGMRFTDSYGEQSCTAGRSSFITGQSVYRTGLSKVGVPGADVGLQAGDPTIAGLLKPIGYATGQFGKNHLGDLNKYLPTVHGFDEFFGNLYHLNAEEEPEHPNWPPADDFPQFSRRFGPRGVVHSWATEEDDPTEDERFGRVGKQRIEDTGPHMNTWPDAGMTPFRSEKDTNWEGAFRVPELIRWPGKIPAGVVSNDIIQHHDWLPTFLAAAGDPDIIDKLKAGHTAGEKTFKVHIDGYNLLPYLTGQTATCPRPGLIYFSDDGDVLAIRFDNWKVVFMEQRAPGTLRICAEPFVALRVPKLFNLRTDPFERADVTSNTYYDWLLDNDFIVLAATALVTQFLESFKEFPPRQKAASFTIDQVVEKLEAAITSHR
jgi:arylsulfatase A-like enzyme